MTKKSINAGLIIVVLASFLMVACSGQQTAQPTATVDANAIYTQAAQTVQAGMAQTESVKPSATFTVTVAPTKTMDPAMATGLTATANAVLNPGKTTPAAGTPQATSVSGTNATPKPTNLVIPTATSAVVAAQPSAKGDKAVLVDQLPKDGTSIPVNAGFDMHLWVKNTGTTTWTPAYTLVYYAGERMGSPADFNMPNEVKPGETVKLLFSLQAPATAGDYQIIWSMRNADGVNFYPIYLKVHVTG